MILSVTLYDISQEVFSCQVYPGDPAPQRKILSSFDEGDPYHLTAFSMCAHNGTHVDVPFHFLREGKTVDQVPLDAFVGKCYVARHQGDVTGDVAEAIMRKAFSFGASQRILVAGMATVTLEGAEIFAAHSLKLLGNESQTVGPKDAPSHVHRVLLGRGIVLLEGIVLSGIPEGQYLLSAAPLNLSGSDGAPCRAYLIKE